VTLQVHTEENDQREVTMTVEVAEERIEKAMRQKARELAREIRIPGFRPGKAPYHVILRRVGKESLRAEVIEDMVAGLFEEAVLESEIDQESLYGRPSLDDMTDEPLVLTFTLPLKPVVTLGDYRALRREIEPVMVTDEAVEEALTAIQNRYAETEEVDRPAELGDLATIGGVGKLLPQAQETETAETEDAGAEEDESETADPQEEIIFDQDRINVILDPEKAFPNTPFVDNLLGLSAGDDVTFIFTFPDDYDDEELAGREARFEVTMVNVQSRDVPPLDDEIAQKEGAATLEELRENVRQQLETEAEDTARNELIEYMVEETQKEAVLSYPPGAIAEEIADMVKDYKQQVTRSGWEWEDFLTIQGLTEETVGENFRESAVKRVETRTIISQLLTQERITLEPEEIDAAVDERLEKYQDERLREGMREYLLKGDGLTNIMNEILTDKLYERIKEILSGTAPDLSELQLIPLEDEEE
jgi:trigger factor